MILRTLLLTALIAPAALLAEVPLEVLNPDVSGSTVNKTICVSGYTRSVRPSVSYTNGIKKRLMRLQGLDFETQRGEFELDHIIPLALGGHPRNLGNLMLQPWEGANSAKRKDRLEVKLQCLVCSSEVPLAEAQAAIWSDWHLAYSKYAQMSCRRDRSVKSIEYGD